jgi:uncharacterized protein
VQNKTITLIDITRATTVGTRITIADTFFTRLIGLVGRRGLSHGCGLLIRPSSGIHTFGMSFPIDVVALSPGLQVLQLWPGMVPSRTTGVLLSTHSMLELPMGQICRCRMEVGDQLELT